MFCIDECHRADIHDKGMSNKTVITTKANNPTLECLSMIAEFLDLLPAVAVVFDVLPVVVVGLLDVLPVVGELLDVLAAVVDEQSGRTLAGKEPITFPGG